LELEAEMRVQIDGVDHAGTVEEHGDVLALGDARGLLYDLGCHFGEAAKPV
jgi:hypothetical protein